MKRIEIIVNGEFESFFYDANHQKRAIELHHSDYSYGEISVLLNRKKNH